MDHLEYSYKVIEQEEDVAAFFDDDSSMPKEETEIDADEKLIDIVKGYKSLYDKLSPDYKNKQIRENAWKEISETMGQAGKWCAKNWKCIHSSVKCSGLINNLFHIFSWRCNEQMEEAERKV